ncbi:beta strand repeat-containing protein, partial [Fusobacterium varium]|uniref:beta strand repeat-containing protein n=1 Tax=Fusobacterium varium TaxID=856 RepID=UPI00399D1B4F|nr:autotransporter domain-containing protein [Fusobacterium varium]
MIEKIMKAVKRGNKRRGRNITIGAVIGFLLSCTAVMGTDSYLWIKGDGGIKFNKEPTNNADGSGGTWVEGNPYENAGNIWDTVKKTYTNNIELSSNGANGKSNGIDISYGLRLSGDLTDVNFINNGSVIGTMSSSSGSSYGIYNSGTMGNIENTGVISGYSSGSSGYGYGINNESGTIGDIANAGVISGAGISSSGYGYGINNKSGKIGDITNTGLISGYGTSTFSSGSGIYNGSSTMGKITNTGLISGYAAGTSTAFAYGICNDSNGKEMGAITNTGIISGNSTSGAGTGSGIYNKSGTIGDIKNAGLISGAGISTGGKGDGYGYGIYNKSGTIGDIKNAGLINVYAASTSTAFASGIFTDSNATKIGNITNTGVISGYGNGLDSGSVSEKSNAFAFGINNGAGTMGNITNAGIISSAGTATSFFAGAGICNSANNKQMGSITNTGVIYGTSNAIKKSDGTIDSSSNYGILVNGDSNNDVVGELKIVDETPKENEILNKGLIFKAVDGGYKAGENEYGKFGKTFDNDAGVTIINAKALGNGKDNITGTESLELKKGTLFYTDSDGIPKEETISPEKRYILNGITNTLEVSEGKNELNGSVINAYKTAVVFGDTGDK